MKILDFKGAHYRSTKRVKELGEVYTPEYFVNKMLNLLVDNKCKNISWYDENCMFFEPTCGHGNFVELIITKRIECLYEKAREKKIKKPHLYAIANAVNTIWAIDLDQTNINICRERVFKVALMFLIKYENRRNQNETIKRNEVFIAHLICAINWQIHENELMSALVDDSLDALNVASKTYMGKEWLMRNKHKSLDFDLTWCEYYKTLQSTNIVPVELTLAIKFLKNRKSKNLSFAKNVLNNISSDEVELSMAG